MGYGVALVSPSLQVKEKWNKNERKGNLKELTIVCIEKLCEINDKIGLIHGGNKVK